MAKDPIPSIRAGFKHVKEHPQLWWTVFVAVVILISFWFLASRFIGIAKEAQDRLIDIRVGSIQDAYVEFLPEHTDDRDFLEKTILNLVTANPTIIDFRVTELNEVGDNVILASLNKAENGTTLGQKYGFLLDNAIDRPEFSFTMQEFGTERLFNTARAYTGQGGEVLGFVVTTQTLSEADQKISQNIQNSVLLFILIVILVMFLFLRHARIIDYISLYKQLQEVDKLKDDFISMASHELRTPLTIIRGYVEFLDSDKSIKGESKEHLLKIDISAKQLDSLVADMLDVSRIQEGRMSFKMENVDLAEIVDSTAEEMKITAERKGLKLLVGSESSEKIFADSARLKQVLVNLIGNAIKYTKEGEIKIRYFVEGERQMIRISDTGIGMDAEDQKHLFEKFYRIKSKETEDIRGTGLGLWITKQIVERMQGDISVESIKGVGTHFVLSFPIAK